LPISSPLLSFTPVILTQTGDVANNNVQYGNAAAVIAALPGTIAVTLVNGSVVNVPITWKDTDTYNAGTAAAYTFTATWGEMPAGANNSNSLAAPTVEVTVAQGTVASGTSPLLSFIPVTLTQTGDVVNNNVQYGNAAAVIAALPGTIAVTLANGSVVNVPITWTDTDTYNAGTAAAYTFTATWGEMPAGANNSNSLAVPTVEVTVAQGIPNSTYTIMYDGNGNDGGSVPTDSKTYASGANAYVLSNSDLTKTGYTFNGWNTAANGSGTSYAENDTIVITANVTLYAQWKQKSTYNITGIVTEELSSDSVGVAGATITLKSGARTVVTGIETDEEGKFTINDVSNGTYNLLVSKNDRIITLVVTVLDQDTDTLVILPTGRNNSVLEIEDDTPEIVVDKLNDFFISDHQYTDEDKEIVNNGGKVEIKLTVKEKDESGDNAATNAAAIKIAVGNEKTIGMFLDLNLSKTVTSLDSVAVTSSAITVLDNVLTLDIPLPTNLQGKSGYVIYRYHDGTVNTITETANAVGEYFELSSDGTLLKLYTKKFSTYAIGYTNPASEGDSGNNGNNGNSGSSSGSSGGNVSTSYTITVSAGEGGSISPASVSVVKGGSKTFAITANEGYYISDVLVDGVSVGAVNSYTLSDISTGHTISAVFTKVTGLPYYIDANGKESFIGFASNAGGTMKYIAPKGVTVLFKENPKSFIDIADHWAKENIDFVTEREIFAGSENSKFGPNTGMTRGMFVTVIGKLYEKSYGSIKGNNTFSDVDTNAYYAKYVAWANENGIIKGIGDNKFVPNGEVTREQMATIMFNYATFLGKAPQGDWMINITYPDKAKISNWAISSAAYCQLKNIITGRENGEFAPKATATRAETAVVVEKFVNEILK
ncbi:MAG: S-layer homology domain-containing protein, partial [Ruminiclostridium sp.]